METPPRDRTRPSSAAAGDSAAAGHGHTRVPQQTRWVTAGVPGPELGAPPRGNLRGPHVESKLRGEHTASQRPPLSAATPVRGWGNVLQGKRCVCFRVRTAAGVSAGRGPGSSPVAGGTLTRSSLTAWRPGHSWGSAGREHAAVRAFVGSVFGTRVTPSIWAELPTTAQRAPLCPAPAPRPRPPADDSRHRDTSETHQTNLAQRRYLRCRV